MMAAPQIASTVPALRVVTVLAIWGAAIIGAVYMLRAVRAVLHGPNGTYAPDVADANAWRKLPFALLLASLLVFGFFPQLLTEKITPVAEQIVSMATATSPSQTPLTPALSPSEGERENRRQSLDNTNAAGGLIAD